MRDTRPLRIVAACVLTLLAVALAPDTALAAELPAPGSDYALFDSPVAVAWDQLKNERENGFADLTESRLTTAQVASVVPGAVEYDTGVEPGDVAGSESIFSSLVVDRNSGWVPLILGDRRIAEISVVKTTGGWQFDGTTGTESIKGDKVRRGALLGLAKELGGTPSKTQTVNVVGSSWILGRRGSSEAAVFLAYGGYGCFAGGSNPPHLADPGEVLPANRYKAVMAGLSEYQLEQPQRERRNLILLIEALITGAALVTGLVIVLVLVLVARRIAF